MLVHVLALVRCFVRFVLLAYGDSVVHHDQLMMALLRQGPWQ